MKDIFSNTRIPKIEDSLKLKFPNRYSFIYPCAKELLEQELSLLDDRGSRVIGNHLKKNILPGFAIYKAIVTAGGSEETAISFVRDEMCVAVKRMSNLTTRLSKKSYAYPLVRFILILGLGRAFPKQGWNCEKIENSKNSVRFNMTSCLYLEELTKRNAEKLCSAFCYTDIAAYSPLSPAVEFIRHGTLAETKTKCDFCFKRGL